MKRPPKRPARPRRPQQAPRIRELLEQGYTPGAIARMLAVTRQAVYQTRDRAEPARPRLERIRVTTSMRAEYAAQLRELAAANGLTLGEQLEAALDALADATARPRALESTRAQDVESAD